MAFSRASLMIGPDLMGGKPARDKVPLVPKSAQALASAAQGSERPWRKGCCAGAVVCLAAVVSLCCFLAIRPTLRVDPRDRSCPLLDNMDDPPGCNAKRHAISRRIMAHIEPKRLAARANASRAAYAVAAPFPHGHVDGLFPDSVMERLREEFPEPSDSLLSSMLGLASQWGPWGHCMLAKLKGWRCIGDKGRGYLKVTNMNERVMGPYLQGVMNAMKTPAFVSYLEQLTGIGPLIVDYTNEGSGQHQIFSGGSLQIHADFNELHIPDEPLRYRRVNVFLYLNEDWEAGWGGDLELWHRGMSTCGGRIAPHSNRLVVFSTTDYSYHGHADPLDCPNHRSRKSIALYYYSMQPAAQRDRLVDEEGNVVPHSTLYQRRKCESCLLEQCRAPHAPNETLVEFLDYNMCVEWHAQVLRL